MKTNLTVLIQHPHITKIFSLVLAYSIWFCVAQHQVISQTYQAPVYFYDTEHKNIQAPESIQITLQGPRKELYNFKTHHASFHLDGAKLNQGQQEIILSRENLFLPDSLKLVDLVPSHISIHVN